MAEVQEYKNVKCDVMGLTMTGVPEHCFDELHSTLKHKLGLEGVSYLGMHPVDISAHLIHLFALQFMVIQSQETLDLLR